MKQTSNKKKTKMMSPMKNRSAMPKGTLKPQHDSKSLRMTGSHGRQTHLPVIIGGNVNPSETVNERILEVDMVHNVSEKYGIPNNGSVDWRWPMSNLI